MPWLLGALGILVAFVITQLSDIISTFAHGGYITGRDRVEYFFGNASIDWAIALLVATILLSLAGRYFPVEPALKPRLTLIRTAVAAAAAFVVLSAVIDLITALTGASSRNGGPDHAFSLAVSYLAIAVLAAATALWAFGLSKVKD